MIRMLVTCRLEATDQITSYKAFRLLGKALFSAYTYTYSEEQKEKSKKIRERKKNEEENETKQKRNEEKKNEFS